MTSYDKWLTRCWGFTVEQAVISNLVNKDGHLLVVVSAQDTRGNENLIVCPQCSGNVSSFHVLSCWGVLSNSIISELITFYSFSKPDSKSTSFAPPGGEGCPSPQRFQCCCLSQCLFNVSLLSIHLHFCLSCRTGSSSRTGTLFLSPHLSLIFTGPLDSTLTFRVLTEDL